MLISQLLQVNNTYLDWDENLNIQNIDSYANQNQHKYSHPSFYGGFVDMERCMYIVNMAETASGQRSYSFETMTVNITYHESLLRKNTNITIGQRSTITHDANSYEDFSCGNTPIKYHPGIKGIFYFLT